MKNFWPLICLLPFLQQPGSNPDLDIKLRENLDDTSDVAILRNSSAINVYTVTIRRREFRKRYRIYQLGNEIPDTVLVKRDTLIRFVDVVVPPKKWRYLGVIFKGESTMRFDKRMRTDTCYASTYKFKIIKARIGGDVQQVYKFPEPFASKQPDYTLFYATGGKKENLFRKYTGDVLR